MKGPNKTYPFEGDETMRHSVTVSVDAGGRKLPVLTAEEIPFREKILTKLFGKKAKVLVITPHTSTNEITIRERGGNEHERSMHFDCG